MAWTSADQNPSFAPAPGLSSPSYSAALQQAAYYNPLSGGSASTGMATAAAASSGGSYADRLNASAAPATVPAPQPTRRALESSSGIQPAKGSQGAREIQPWGGGGTRFEIAGRAAEPGRVGKANDALVDIMRKAAEGSPFNVQLFSGYRPGDKRQHGRGNAVDIALVDPYSGEPLANYQSAETFPQYEAFAKRAYEIAQRDYPDLAGNFRWGGYFGGGRGKYGAVDTMHFDVNSGMGMAGGSWDTGLTDRQRRIVSRMDDGRTQWAGPRPGVTAPPPTMYAGDPFGVSGARGNAVLAGGDVPAPRMRPGRTEMAYAPSPETMDTAPFDAVLGASRDRRPQPPAPPANPRRDRLQQPAAQAAAPAGGAYVVQRGDNLSRIGQQFGVSPQEIAAANGLRNPDLIQPGQRLVIPGGRAPARAPVAPREAPAIPQPRMRPSREVAMPQPRMRPQPAANRVPPRASRETWNSMGLGSRGNAETQMSIDRPPQRRPAVAPPPNPYDDPSRQYDTPGNVTMANERMGVFEGSPAPENWRPRPNFSAANPPTRVPPAWSPVTEFPPAPVPAGPGMDTTGLVREPSADERALQSGARFQMPTGGQMIDPRNTAQMDRADGVYRPIAEPGGPPWVASNGIRFFAVR